jgi:hypothetical protein
LGEQATAKADPYGMTNKRTSNSKAKCNDKLEDFLDCFAGTFDDLAGSFCCADSDVFAC